MKSLFNLDSYWVPGWWSISTLSTIIPTKAGIHIKLIYKNIFNETFLKNHAGIIPAADRPGTLGSGSNLCSVTLSSCCAKSQHPEGQIDSATTRGMTRA